jgi:hypothetical protein
MGIFTRSAGLIAVAAGLAFAGLVPLQPAHALDTTPDPGTPGGGLVLAPPGGASPVNSHAVLHGDVITLRLEDPGDRYRVERVELLGPGGISVVASDISRQVLRSYGFSSDGKDDSAGLGVKGSGNGGAALTFGSNENHAGANYDDKRTAVTRAHLRVPDLDSYKADVTQWKFRVRLLDDSGNSQTMEIPAPEP